MTNPATESHSPIERIIATELSVTRGQVWAAIKLLDSGATVPFIARYRKEATGGLSDSHLRMLADRLDYLRELEEQRQSILHSIEAQGKLNDTLKAAIQNAATKSELDDFYLPFRQKKLSKAKIAREAGLEPLALKLLADPSLSPETSAQNFIDPLKDVLDISAALTGAREILIERFSEDAGLIGLLRKKFWDTGWIIAKGIPGKDNAESKFSDYFNFREPIRSIPSHRMLALLRGRQEEVLKVSLETEGFGEYNQDAKDGDAEFIGKVCDHFNIRQQRRPADLWLLEAARFTWKYKIRLHLELDILMRLRKEAEEEAIRVFAQNLKNLLLAAPAGPRVTMGLDPGFRTGVKVAVVDQTGKVLDTAVIYPHAPQEDLAGAALALTTLIKKHRVELISIGNGTASRETDQFVIHWIRQNPGSNVQKVIVSEAGASVYSASALASEELPSMDVSLRGAVSIARRVQDPLAELVKIEPKAIGVGQYQHDVNQSRLGKMLRNVVEDCVNAVGVDVNTASLALLSYISGLTKKTAENLLAFRDKHGTFKNRLDFKNIPDFGPKTFEQAAGFLRILNGDNPLDASAVHPESYPLVEKILKKNNKELKEVLGNSHFLRSIHAEHFADETFGAPTIQDILAELEKPGRDPRPEFRTAAFKENVQTIDDLKPGMILEGSVTNVANFGAFVDIGVHQDGLVHISEISDEFTHDPHDIVRTGQIVKVKVLEIDKPRQRISLSMRLKAAAKAKIFSSQLPR